MPKIFYRPDIENVIKVKEDKWFRDQRLLLLQLANTDYGKDLLCVPKNYKNIFKFGKNHIFYNPRMEDGVYKYDWDFRVGAKWANVIRKRWEEFQGAALFFQSQNSMRPVALVGNRQYLFGGPYFPDPDVEITSVDGVIQNDPGGATDWATARGAADGTGAFDATANTQFVRSSVSAGDYLNYRSFYLFDTSALADNENITAATFSLAGSAGATVDTDVTNATVVSSSPASNTALVIGDYDQVGTTSFGTITLANWVNTDGTYNDITLNSSGITNISKTGISKFGTVSGRDFSNSAPTGDNRINAYYADQAGTTTDPKLTGTSTTPATVKATGAALLLGVGA